MKGFQRFKVGQAGSALVVALIMLLLLTMLGVQGMRTNVMQERMAGNVRDRNLAFQAAEAALRVGETVGDFASDNIELVNAGGWDGSGADGTVAAFDAGLSDDPAYHVGPPQYVRIGITVPPEWRYLYPVTAIGFGGQLDSVTLEGSTVVVVQSSFEPIN